MTHSLATVINFCSNDWRFLSACVESARRFSQQIIISVCDHFFNGEPENYALLEHFYKLMPDCLFLEFHFDNENPYGRAAPIAAEDLDGVHHWHNTGRLIPYYFLESEVESVLYLDADEIIDADRFQTWLDGFDHRSYSGLRLASYWYFREARYQATAQADISLLVKRSVLSPDAILDPDERMGLYCQLSGEKKMDVLGLDGRPLVHHYSWVRTKEEMLKKTRTWGHHWERDWTRLIDEEYAKGFTGKDFARGFEYVEIEPFWNPLEQQIPELDPIDLEKHIENVKSFYNVRRITPEEIFRMDLEQQLRI
jgi:hypothetical protein